MSKINVSCTAGDGPDILLSICDKNVLLLSEPVDLDKWVHGVVKNAQICLSMDETERLILELQNKLMQAKEFYSLLDDILSENQK